MSKPEIRSPADVYDTLELATLATGGIGLDFEFMPDEVNGWELNHDCPVCLWGHAEWAGIIASAYEGSTSHFIPTRSGDPFAWRLVPIPGMVSDKAVEAINARHGRSSDERVSFAEYCAELNIVRGD